MTQVIDQRPYSNGLDLDADERLIKPGDYVYGVNGRSGTSDQNHIGAVESSRGNVLRNINGATSLPYAFPSGTNRCIGAIEDVKYQTIIYFLWNSGNNHRIIRYFLKEKVVRDVIPTTWTGFSSLNFQRFSKIWNGKIVYAGEQDYIIWTDGINPIRKIRLDIGTAYPAGAIEPQVIDFAKQPPQRQPTTTVVASSVNTFTAGKGFQFATRYVYDDNSITTLSPYSDIRFVDEVNKSIRVEFFIGHYTVKEIQVLAREGNGKSAEGTINPTWYIVKKLPRPTSSFPPTATYDFSNTELKEAIARIDSDKLFESIPELAGCMELSETNQVIVADITEGKDNPVITNDTNGVTVQNVINRNPIGTTSSLLFRTLPTQGVVIIEQAQINQVGEVPIYNMQNLVAENGFVLYEQAGVFNGFMHYKKISYSPFVPQTAVLSMNLSCAVFYNNPAQFGTFFSAIVRLLIFKNGSPIVSQDLLTDFNTGVAQFNISTQTSVLQGDNLAIGVALINPAPGSAGLQLIARVIDFNLNVVSGAVKKCLKENTQTQIGIQYYDREMRSGGIVPIVSPPVTAITNATPITVDSTQPYLPLQRVSIHNRPPLWAHFWSVCIKETNIEYGWFTVVDISTPSGKTTFTYQNTVRDFEPQEGDFVRIIGARTISSVPDQYEVFNSVNNIELKVSSVDLTQKQVSLDGVISTTITATSQRPMIIEIFRLKPVTPFYFEQKINPVENPSTVVRAHSVQNQEAGEQSQSAISPIAVPARINVYGDSYTRFGDAFLVYSKLFNNGYESDFWDKGRPAIEITNGGAKRLINGIRWGGQLFPNTLVNNMSVFDAGNYASTNQTNGTINAMRLRGYTLKIYQESNTNSAYLNRRSITNADGSDQLVLTDNLITQINPSQQGQGTLHKGSVIMYGDDIYFFDAINGLMIRDAENGQIPISNYGAQRYFRDLSELAREYGNAADILCGYDEKTQQLFVTFAEHDSLFYNNKTQTISFSEGQVGDSTKNRWKFFHDHSISVGEGDFQQPLDMYSKMGNNMFMFMNGRCWESNELVDNNGNPVYLRFFGEDRPFVLTGVSNIEPTKVKIFLAHSIHANRTPNFVLIKTPKSAMYPIGMESELKPANYALREGVYYADIKRDAFTKGVPPNIDERRKQIAGGRPIRGNSMTYEMTWTGNEYVVLFTSGITVIPSEKS
jgi:hypothetical protein